MDSELGADCLASTVAQVLSTQRGTPPDASLISLAEDIPEGGMVAEERSLSDPWGEPAARRAMGFLAHRKVGPRMSSLRIDPLPIDGTGRDLRWACFAPQDEIDGWRASCPHADSALTATARWLAGNFLSFGYALAKTFPLGELQDALLACLDIRHRDVLRRRVSGETLESLGARLEVTRERVRQIETAAVERLTNRLVSMRAVRHPAGLALLCHASRLAVRVLDVATREDGVLREEAKRQWIRRVLPEGDAEWLLILLRLGEDADPDLRPVFDPLDAAGSPFQGGRTALPWQDEDVAALAAGFEKAVEGRGRRSAPIAEIRAASGLSADAVAVLAHFANLTVHNDQVFEGPLKASDARRATLAEILAKAGQAMNEAEILEELVPLGLGSDAALRDMHRAMSDDAETFVSDGRASWQLRRQLGDRVEDRRPEHPDIPPPMSLATLRESLALLPGPRPGVAALEGMSPEDGAFAVTAGGQLADALATLPSDERASLAQILRPEDETKLLAWLAVAVPGEHPEGAGQGTRSPRMLEGLTMLAAFVAAIRTSAGSDDAHWAVILAACGGQARGWIFNSQRAVRRKILSRLVEVAACWRLRRAFSFRSDPWSTLLTLQAGLLRKDIEVLPRWLGKSLPTVAIRQLVAPGTNHSASFACTWNILQSYRRGLVGRDAVEVLAQQSEWWPGWSVDEACRACVETVWEEAPRKIAEQTEPALIPKPEVSAEAPPATADAALVRLTAARGAAARQ